MNIFFGSFRLLSFFLQKYYKLRWTARKEKTRLKISLQDHEASVSQKYESKLLHIYVLNYFLTADRSCRETLTIHAFGRIRNRRNFPSKTAILPFSNISVPRIIDQFGRKRCHKKRKDVNYQILYDFFQKTLLYMNGRLSKIHVFARHCR